MSVLSMCTLSSLKEEYMCFQKTFNFFHFVKKTVIWVWIPGTMILVKGGLDTIGYDWIRLDRSSSGDNASVICDLGIGDL